MFIKTYDPATSGVLLFYVRIAQKRQICKYIYILEIAAKVTEH